MKLGDSLTKFITEVSYLEYKYGDLKEINPAGAIYLQNLIEKAKEEFFEDLDDYIDKRIELKLKGKS